MCVAYFPYHGFIPFSVCPLGPNDNTHCVTTNHSYEEMMWEVLMDIFLHQGLRRQKIYVLITKPLIHATFQFLIVLKVNYLKTHMNNFLIQFFS